MTWTTHLPSASQRSAADNRCIMAVGGPCHVKGKNTRNALDAASLSYAVIGLDLAKADCAVAALPCSDDELGLIDRMDYESLLNKRRSLSLRSLRWSLARLQSDFLRLQNMGTRSRSFPDTQSKNWIAALKSNQKTKSSTMQRLWRSLLFTIMIYSRFASRTLRSARISSVRRSESSFADTGYKILSLAQNSVPMLGRWQFVEGELEHKRWRSSRSR